MSDIPPALDVTGFFESTDGVNNENQWPDSSVKSYPDWSLQDQLNHSYERVDDQVQENPELNSDISNYLALEKIENQVDRLFGRSTVKDNVIVEWFESQDMDITVQPAERKGMGVFSKRPIDVSTIVLTCPPYLAVPYECRKQSVCAYCFREIPQLEELYREVTDEANSQTDASYFEAAEQEEQEHCFSVPSQQFSTDEQLTEEQQQGIGEGEEIAKLDQPAMPLPAYESSTPQQFIVCKGCYNVYYCSEECLCLDYPEHSKYECPALNSMQQCIPPGDNEPYEGSRRTDVRLLIQAMSRRKTLEDSGRNEFDRVYDSFIANKYSYTESMIAWLMISIKLALFLIPEEAAVSEEKLFDIYIKNRSNMFGIWNNQRSCLGYAIYAQASYFNHSCYPNTNFYKYEFQKRPYLSFVTVWPIDAPNEELCISYIDISANLKTRRDELLRTYFFHCTCPRCILQQWDQNAEDPYYTQWIPQYQKVIEKLNAKATQEGQDPPMHQDGEQGASDGQVEP